MSDLRTATTEVYYSYKRLKNAQSSCIALIQAHTDHSSKSLIQGEVIGQLGTLNQRMTDFIISLDSLLALKVNTDFKAIYDIITRHRNYTKLLDDSLRKAWVTSTPKEILDALDISQITKNLEYTLEQIEGALKDTIQEIQIEFLLDRDPEDVLIPAQTSEPRIAIAWDTDTVDPDDYTELVAALNQFVQEHGQPGLKLIKSDTVGVNCGAGVTA